MAQSTKRSAANPYRTGGPSQYFQTRGGTSSIPVTGIRTGAKVSVGGGKGGAPAAKGASAEAPKVPTGVEPGEPSAPEYNPIIDAETMSPPVDPNRQEAILNQARAPRFAIGNPNVGNIDLGSLLSAKPTEGFDPNAPIGGANVPFQETKGVGGFFRRMFGDTANEQNIAAQQAQAAEWKAEDTLAKQRQAKREDELSLIEAREKGPTERFKAEQKRLEDKEIRDEIAREDAINLQLAREGEKDILSDIDMARKEARDAAQQALEERKVKLAEDVANKARYRTIQTEKGGATVIDEHTGKPLRTYHPPTIGMIIDPKTGKETAGNIPGRWEEYTERPKAPVNTGGGAQVDRTTGATFGGPLMDEKLPPGGGVRMGGALPPTPQVTPMRAAAPSPEADASLLGRFRTAMPSLNFAQPSGRGYQVAPLTEGDVAQQAMEQIAYPLRAAAAQEAKSGFQNPEEAAYILEEKPKWRFRRAGATEMSEARKAGDILRQMYAE